MEFPGAFSYTLEEVLHFIFEQIKRPAEGSKFYTRYPQACVGYGYEAWSLSVARSIYPVRQIMVYTSIPMDLELVV